MILNLLKSRGMSSLIFLTEETQVLVATDTLGTSTDGRPFIFTTKAFVVPHLRMIIAGTGTGGFLGRWFVGVNDLMVVRGIDDLDDHASRNLGTLWRGYKQELSLTDSARMTVYHFGFSEETGLIHSFVYRSTNEFSSEPLEYGVGVKPICTIPETLRLPQDIRKMMDEQRAIYGSQASGQRVYIGGEIQIHNLTENGFQVYTLERFDDYEHDEKAIYERTARPTDLR